MKTIYILEVYRLETKTITRFSPLSCVLPFRIFFLTNNSFWGLKFLKTLNRNDGEAEGLLQKGQEAGKKERYDLFF